MNDIKTEKIAIVFGCDEPLIDDLERMLSTIDWNELGSAYSGVCLDPGLTEQSKDRIRAYVPKCLFVEPRWFVDFAGKDKLPAYKKIAVTRAFLPEAAPGYDVYIWVDSDIWFQDSSALCDFREAAREGKLAVAADNHPHAPRLSNSSISLNFFRNPLYLDLKDYTFRISRKLFSYRDAVDSLFSSRINNGVTALEASSPIWGAWQDRMHAAKFSSLKNKRLLCEQSCLFQAIRDQSEQVNYMPATHNWTVHTLRPAFDAETNKFVDVNWPNAELKVIHLAAQSGQRTYEVKNIFGGVHQMFITPEGVGSLKAE